MTTKTIDVRKGDVLEVDAIGMGWRFYRRLRTKADIVLAVGLLGDSESIVNWWRLVRDGVVVG